MEAAKILAALKQQEAKLNDIIDSQNLNSKELDALYNAESLDIQQIEAHRDYGLKLATDIKNQERVIANTKMILEKKQQEVREAQGSQKSRNFKKIERKTRRRIL